VTRMDADRFARIEITDASQLWDWLARNHAQPDSVWLVTWKAAHPTRYVSREAVLDALIAHGWIDGRRLKLDADRTMQLISPRKQQAWAASYKARAARLIAEGRMHAAGRTALEAGRARGLWHLSDPIDALREPEDLVAALEAAGGLPWWRASAPSYRRNILRYLAAARRAETRRKRTLLIATHCARGEKIPQY
jgi:uncharacterized protein YdeI (YjbR/CyaY-like superfamily)